MKHEEELERLRIEEEERKKKEAEERRLMGIHEEEEKKKKTGKKQESKKEDETEDDEENEIVKELEDEADESEQKKKIEEWRPYIPEVPNKINWAHYSSPDTFWLSMDDYDAGYLYEYKFLTDTEKSKLPLEKIDEPIAHVPVQKSDLIFDDDIPLSCLTFR